VYNDERAGVGTHSLCYSKAARKDGTLARPELVPTPARGNQKINGLRRGNPLWLPDT